MEDASSESLVLDLRQRFNISLREEDGESALRAYTSSVDDLSRWKEEEIESEMKKKMERKKDLAHDRPNLISFSNMFQSTSRLHSLQPKNRKERSIDDINSFKIRKELSFRSLLSSHENDSNALSTDNENGTSRNDYFDRCERSLKKSTTTTTQFSPNNSNSILQKMMPPSSLFSMYNTNTIQNNKPINTTNRKGVKLFEDFPTQSQHKRIVEMSLEEENHGRTEEQEAYDKVDSTDEETPSDPELTTPLHEAARLGEVNLVKYMLVNSGDPNVRDGFRRTVLHSICGGITQKESSLMRKLKQKKLITNDETSPIDLSKIQEKDNDDVGIQLYVPPSVLAQRKIQSKKNFLFFPFSLANKAKKKGKDRHVKNENSTSTTNNSCNNVDIERQNDERALARWNSKRTDCFSLIIAKMQGPSLNSVDLRARTALHYAAELGREDMCARLLEHSHVILTIIDENGRTPCELASMQGHMELAARLEARAIIGGGEDAAVLAGWSMLQEEDAATNEVGNNFCTGNVWGKIDNDISNKQLVPPFCWFETFEDVDGIRTTMIEEAHDKFENALLSYMLSSPETGNGDQSILMNENLKCGESSVVGKKRLTINQVSKLLSMNQWNFQKTIDKYQRDPNLILADLDMGSFVIQNNDPYEENENVCLICFDEFEKSDPQWIKLQNCRHSFCRNCLIDYLTSCANSRSHGIMNLPCPHHDCKATLDLSEIEKLLELPSNKVFTALLKIENENFVANGKDFSFCPSPGCEGIVHRLTPSSLASQYDEDCLDYIGAVCTFNKSNNIPKACSVVTYEGVLDPNYNSLKEMPLRAHRFCFTCKGSSHWPIQCENLNRWNTKVSEEVGDSNVGSFEDIAQNIWLKTNTRPCPKCNVPIEKNDGCNHMTCTNRSCRHEFCWICRKDWRLHNSKTGGYFRCNRWQEDGGDSDLIDAPSPSQTNESITSVEQEHGDEYRFGTAMFTARISRKKNREMARFLHHYSRWSAHKESASLESKMRDSVCERMSVVVSAAKEVYQGNMSETFLWNDGLSFIHSAFIELLEARSFLENSYAFAYYRYSKVSNYSSRIKSARDIEKVNFEMLQSALEMLTEQLSDILARKHLRATISQIMYMTSAVANKRIEFNRFMIGVFHQEKKEKLRKEKRKNSKRRMGTDIMSNEGEGSSSVPLERSYRNVTREYNDDDSFLDSLTQAAVWGRPSRSPVPFDDENFASSLDGRFEPNPFGPGEVLGIQEFTPGEGQSHGYDRYDADFAQDIVEDSEEVAFQLAIQASMQDSETIASDDGFGSSQEPISWNCPTCTYFNRLGSNCAMCGTSR